MDVREKQSSEKRLIDACALQKAIRTDYFEHFTQYHDSDQIALIDMVCDDIEESPTVEAVEVVRCKDCLYSTERYGHMKCINGVSYRNTWNKPDFFCSYGERKEGADNG